MTHDAITDRTNAPAPPAPSCDTLFGVDGDALSLVDPASLSGSDVVVVGRVKILVPVSEMTQAMPPGPAGASVGGYQSQPSPISLNSVRYVKVERFIVRRSRDRVVSDLQARLGGKDDSITVLRGQVREAKAELLDAEKKLAATVKAQDLAEGLLDVSRKRCDDIEPRRRKLEEDLAKVRRAIGERSFNEIVGS